MPSGVGYFALKRGETFTLAGSYEMPALPQQMLDCVFYLYRRDPKTGEIDNRPSGTGTIVVHYSRRHQRNVFLDKIADEPDIMAHYYGVTNWHLANRAGASIIRINTKDGQSRYLEYDPSEWQFIPNSDDISAIDLTDDLDLGVDLVAAYPEYNFITERLVEKLEVRVGENAVMVGMYKDHSGERQIHPVARFGNLAFVATNDSLVKQPNGFRRASHLVDSRSRTGFSGSPVSIWRTPTDAMLNPRYKKWDARFDRALDDLREGHSEEIYVGSTTLFVGLLGIHCGQFWDSVKAYKAPPSGERDGEPIHEGDELYIQSGMTIVVPAWRVSELLRLNIFKEVREQRDNARRIDFSEGNDSKT